MGIQWSPIELIQNKLLNMKQNMYTIQNLKCGGCATQIISKLSKLDGVSNVIVDEQSSTVSFDNMDTDDLQDVIRTLNELGYPLIDAENSLKQKAKSYASCMVGRMKENNPLL